MTGSSESRTPKTPRTPKTTKAWNINMAKIPLDESLNFDYEDAEKSKMCGVKLRSNDLDKWLHLHKAYFNEDFEKEKGTRAVWKSTQGTTSLSLQTTTAQKSGKSLLSIHFYISKKGLMVQGQETKWWAERIYPEFKNSVNTHLDKRTRSSSQVGTQRVRDAVDSFSAIASLPTTPNNRCPTIITIDNSQSPLPNHPHNLEHLETPDGSSTECIFESGAKRNKDAATNQNGEEQTKESDTQKERHSSVNEVTFGELQNQFVGLVDNFNTLKDDLISKDRVRDDTQAKILKDLTTQVEATQKSLESHIRKVVSKLQNDLSKANKDLIQQREKQAQETIITRNLWEERIRDMSVKVDSLSASNAELQDIIKQQDAEMAVLVDRSKELEQKVESCRCNMTKVKTAVPLTMPSQHDKGATSSHDTITSHNNDATTANRENNRTPILRANKTGIDKHNTYTRPCVSSDKASTTKNSTQCKDNGAEVQIFADSIFRDVDPTRAFQGRSAKLHRSSTITAAIGNVKNMKDTTTKTVIIHVGSNDLDNGKHRIDSVHETVQKTYELLETTKQSFPNAQVAVSQVLQRGQNQRSVLNENIKQYNQEMLQRSSTLDVIYIKHRKLTQDRSLYLADQIHLNPRSGTKHLVADVKRTLEQPSRPTTGSQQSAMANPRHGHRPFNRLAPRGYRPSLPKRDNFPPVQRWSTQPPRPAHSNFVHGGLGGQHNRINANAVPLGTRTPSQPSSTKSAVRSQAGGSQQIKKQTTPTTLQLKTLKQLKLPWKEIGKNIRRAWDILTS